MLARASGLTAYALLTTSILAGLVLKSRPFRSLRPAAVTDTHRFLALLALATVVLHGAALMLDSTVHLRLVALLVPGLSPYRPLATGSGVLAAELMLVVYGSFSLRRRIGAAELASPALGDLRHLRRGDGSRRRGGHGHVAAVDVLALPLGDRVGRRGDGVARPHASWCRVESDQGIIERTPVKTVPNRSRPRTGSGSSSRREPRPPRGRERAERSRRQAEPARRAHQAAGDDSDRARVAHDPSVDDDAAARRGEVRLSPGRLTLLLPACPRAESSSCLVVSRPELGPATNRDPQLQRRRDVSPTKGS